MTARSRRYISDEHFEGLVGASKDRALELTSFPGHPVTTAREVLNRLNFQQRYRFLMETGKFGTYMSEEEEREHVAKLRGARTLQHITRGLRAPDKTYWPPRLP